MDQLSRPNHIIRNNNNLHLTPKEKSQVFTEYQEEVHQIPENPNLDLRDFDQVSAEVAQFQSEEAAFQELPEPPNEIRGICLLTEGGVRSGWDFFIQLHCRNNPKTLLNEW